MERLDRIIHSGGAHVLGGASSDVTADHAYSQRRRKGRSRNSANDRRKSRGACRSSNRSNGRYPQRQQATSRRKEDISRLREAGSSQQAKAIEIASLQIEPNWPTIFCWLILAPQMRASRWYRMET